MCWCLTAKGVPSFNPRPRRGAGATQSVTLDAGKTYVSILARAEARALQSETGTLRRDNVFQSSPAPRRGRYQLHHRCARYWRCFNPRPRRGAGATRANDELDVAGYVSILARAEARALRLAVGTQRNPSHVSILARAEARALR